MARTLRTPAGQEALVESWRRLAAASPSARVTQLDVGVAAVFPEWSVLNNAIVERQPDVDAAAASLRSVYDAAGIQRWALWIASPAVDFAADDVIVELEGFRRDTTTLIMQAQLGGRRAFDPRIARTPVATATRAADDPVASLEIERPDLDAHDVEGWVLVEDGLAISGAWSVIHHGDCGIYSVGTVPAWRRRGHARALVNGVLDDAFRRGAKTASLQSTQEAQSLYAAVGFHPAGRYEEWVPLDT